MSSDFMTKTERQIFDVVADSVSVKDAAQKLGVSTQDLYNFFYLTRKKFYKRLAWCNQINGQRSRGRLLKRILTDRKHGRLKLMKAKEKQFLDETEALDKELSED